jgi:Zn-dependent protease
MFDSINFNDILRQLSVSLIPFLMAITVHEASHGYAAYALGDPTAKMHGRLTLNPIAHIDPIGLACLILTQMFGWAKPVPVNFGIVSRKKYGPLMVAAAGPLSNLLLAVISAILLVISLIVLTSIPEKIASPVTQMLIWSVKINVTLAVFNLIPILTLDGGRILENLLPRDLAYQYSKLERWGMLIVIALLFTRVLNPFLSFAIGGIYNIIMAIPKSILLN